MKNIFGNHITMTLFGESHGPAIGCVLDGLPSGLIIDPTYIQQQLALRQSLKAISTSRREEDQPIFLSGIKDGYSEGTPLAIMIENKQMQAKDYTKYQNLLRPGHADYTGHIRYEGYEDTFGGGHFSGRLTAPIVAGASILRYALEKKKIVIGSHMEELYGIKDKSFTNKNLKKEIQTLNQKEFAVLDDTIGEKMQEAILEARKEGDSLGGILETVIYGLPAGLGEPFFDSLESQLAHALFSIPGVKGVSFGSGFEFAKQKGSQLNDAFEIKQNKIQTKTNHNGGINGGISNGMPIIIHTVIKPTPSIALPQETINIKTKKNTTIAIEGRHDPAIIHRARVVVDNLCAFVIADVLQGQQGYHWWK